MITFSFLQFVAPTQEGSSLTTGRLHGRHPAVPCHPDGGGVFPYYPPFPFAPLLGNTFRFSLNAPIHCRPISAPPR